MGADWTLFTEDEVLRAAGEGAEVERSGSVAFALGPHALVIVVDAGERPSGTRLTGRRRVELREPLEDPIASWFGRLDLPWLVYARLPGGECVPLGRRGEISGREGGGLDLELEKPLAFALLDLLQPAREQRVPGIDWLTLLSHDRVAALQAFVEGWYADAARPGTEAPEAAMALPVPLRMFYRLAAREPLLYGVHNEIFRPCDLEYDEGEGGVVVAAENQGVWRKVIDPDEADPVVYDDGEPDQEPLSGFLMQFTLVEAVMAAPYQATADLTAQQWARLAQRLTPVPLAAPTFVAVTAALHVAPGLVVLSHEPRQGRIEATAGTLQRPVLSKLCDPGFEWRFFEG